MKWTTLLALTALTAGAFAKIGPDEYRALQCNPRSVHRAARTLDQAAFEEASVGGLWGGVFLLTIQR